MKGPGLGHVRLYVLTLAIVLLTGAIVSLYVSLRRAHSQYEALAVAEGHAVFQAVMAMREWTSKGAGIYVSTTELPPMNQYPQTARQDPVRTSGVELTRINHAQMVRMLSEVLTEERGIGLHITSLQPLLARNAPDPWEKQALMSFSAGKVEAQTIVKSTSGDSVFRYMAPLKVDRSCMECHHEPTNVGEVRGGITVSFSFAPFQKSMQQSARVLWLVHVLGLGVSLGLVALLGTRLIQNVGKLQTSLKRIRQLEDLVPICATCKRIRLEGGDPTLRSSWVPVEKYIGELTTAKFTHGMCPDCFERATLRKNHSGLSFRA